MIVSAAITVVIAALMIGVTSGMLSAWNRSRGALTAANQARLALEELSRDVQTALYQGDGNIWLAATIQPALASHGWNASGVNAGAKPDVVVVDAREISECRFGRAGMWLRFFASGTHLRAQLDPVTDLPIIDPATGKPKTEEYNAPGAVGYQLVRRRVGNSSNAALRYMLFRSGVRATTRDRQIEDDPNDDPNPDPDQDQGTFQVGYNLAAAAYDTGDATFARNPGTIKRPHLDTAMAMNVVDFGVRFRAADGTLLFPAPGDVDYLVSSGGAALPATVEVFMRVLTEEGAAQIEALEAGNLTGDWWEIAESHSQTYTHTIPITARPF